MFKKITAALSLFTFLLITSSAMAADNSDVVGEWAMVLDAQGQIFELDLSITESSEGLAGTIGSSQGGGPLMNVSFDGESLKYVMDDGQGGSLDVTLKLDGDDLKGSLSTPMGDMPITAKRK